jgi:hypothetical protein
VVGVVIVEFWPHVGYGFSVHGSEVDDTTPVPKKVEEAVEVMEVFQPWYPVEHVVFTTSGSSVDDGASEGGAVMVVVISKVVVMVMTSREHSGSAVTVAVPLVELLASGAT